MVDYQNAPISTGINDDITTIKLDSYNIEQAEWYGLLSTINQDGSTTIMKSQSSSVDIVFEHNGGIIAECKASAHCADTIDKAGMWDDGDFEGAWNMYDVAG